ncbi:hypothetical protein EDL96_11540 [Kocuria soli]|uniref:Uncharacterized protein n=1 Tax=Kocuria soli TaxID=2485125 RepID=A0A3N3ZMY7_9MICC|nr:hypothetical protein [Kocuria soli]ROZ62086.1 hypothetical protein EDL96_11540 [Kocuria soli]
MSRSLRCAACATPIPDPRPTQRFCNKRCRDRANWRRSRGLPEQDPATKDQDLPSITKLDRQIAGKDRTIARLRAGRQVDRDRARAAEVAAAAADRRAERAIESMGRDQHAISRRNADLADALRQVRQEAKTQSEHVDQLREVLTRFRVDAEQREQAERQVPIQTIRRQWEALAARLARQASGKTALPLAGLDQEVVTTWQRLRQQTPAPSSSSADGKAPAPARPTRPTARPKRKNR